MGLQPLSPTTYDIRMYVPIVLYMYVKNTCVSIIIIISFVGDYI